MKMEPIFLGYSYTSKQELKIEVYCQNVNCKMLNPNGSCRSTSLTFTLKPNKGADQFQITCSKFQVK